MSFSPLPPRSNTRGTLEDPETLRLIREAGIKVAFGSDVMVNVKGKTRGAAAAGYVVGFVEAGFPADEILRVFTVNAARLLGVEKQRGTLAPGLAADIVAVPDDPLKDPTALQLVHFVMKDGRVIRSTSPSP